MRFLTFVFLLIPVSAIFAQQQHISHYSGQMTLEGRSRNYFEEAYKELEAMLEGRDSLDYERAVFLTENAYWDNQIAYSDFQNLLDLHTERIRKSASTIKEKNQHKYDSLKRYEKKNFHPLIANAAIYHYLTSPQLVVSDNNTIKIETLFRYSQYDPYGTDDWTNSQVLSLLNPTRREGNCYAWTALFKIFSERLKSEAFISTAPHHVYIQHKDIKGGFYNVELPTRTFPGDGTIETLTYTTREGIMSGIAMRRLNLKESIGLCLIYLAKGYEYKFGESDAYFSLRCSNLALKHDSLNLNAMLLKAGVMEERLVRYMKEKHIEASEQLREIAEIKDVFSQYEKWINRLNALGYREIPSDVQDILLAKARGEEISTYKDRTPEAFPDLDVQDVTYITLSNGLFDEVHVKQKYMSYGRTVLDTETGKISEIVKEDSLRRYKVDPVVFALSVDPLAHKMPFWSPYAAFGNNPIIANDPDGKKPEVKITSSEDGKSVTITVINKLYVVRERQEMASDATGSFPVSDLDISMGLRGGTIQVGDVTATVEFKPEINYVGSEAEAKRMIDSNKGIGVIVHEYADNGRAMFYSDNEGYDHVDYFSKGFKNWTNTLESMSLTVAHELAHDIGYADKYLDVKGFWGSVTVKLFVNSLTGDATGPLTDFELAILAHDVLHDKENLEKTGRPVNMKNDTMPIGTEVEGVGDRKGGKTYNEVSSKFKVTGYGQKGKEVKNKK